MANFGKYKGYMTHNAPYIEGYEVINTFKSKTDAKEELQDIKDSYRKGMIKPFFEGWAVYQKIESNPSLTKGTTLRKFSGKQFYYAGRTLYPSKARLTALELAERGIDVKVTQDRGKGNLIWTEKRTNLDLSEPITGYYRNPKQSCNNCYNRIITRGLVPHETCLELIDPETGDGSVTKEMWESNGKGCKSWIPQTKHSKGWYRNPEKFYTKEQLVKKYEGKYIDVYPHHFEVKSHGEYITVYEVRGVSRTIRENYNLPEDAVLSNPKSGNMTKALTMKARYKEDLAAGHKDAAEYWRGQASAYFTGNPLVEVSECPKCHRKSGQKHKAIGRKPTWQQLQEWEERGYSRATDGCRVELDGTCPHGHTSWLRVLGYI